MAVICAWQKSPTAGIATSHARIAPRDILLMSAKAIRGVLIFMLMILVTTQKGVSKLLMAITFGTLLLMGIIVAHIIMTVCAVKDVHNAQVVSQVKAEKIQYV